MDIAPTYIWILDFSCNRRYCLSGDRWSQPVEITPTYEFWIQLQPVDSRLEVVLFQWRPAEPASANFQHIQYIVDKLASRNLWIWDRRWCLSGDRWSQPVEIAARHLVPLTTNDQRQLPVVISLLFSTSVSPLASSQPHTRHTLSLSKNVHHNNVFFPVNLI